MRFGWPTFFARTAAAAEAASLRAVYSPISSVVPSHGVLPLQAFGKGLTGPCLGARAEGLRIAKLALAKGRYPHRGKKEKGRRCSISELRPVTLCDRPFLLQRLTGSPANVDMLGEAEPSPPPPPLAAQISPHLFWKAYGLKESDADELAAWARQLSKRRRLDQEILCEDSASDCEWEQEAE